MKKTILVVAALALLALPANVLAGPIPYPNIGTPNPDVYTFFAAGDGPVVAYFYYSDASFDSDIGLIVNNVSQGIYGLENHAVTTVYGTAFSFNNVSAGDLLEFELRVSAGYSVFSTPSLNSDQMQHVYSTAWAGDAVIPAGVYVGFEDLLNLGDIDYNDHQFVFTNVGTPVPDGGFTLALLGAALAGIGMIRRKLS